MVFCFLWGACFICPRYYFARRFFSASPSVSLTTAPSFSTCDQKHPAQQNKPNSTEFKLRGEIGAGNFSRVFRATHRLDGVTYAIKRSRRPVATGGPGGGGATSAEREHWLAEAQALAALGAHPHVVQYFGAWAEPDVHGDHLYLQLELCEGGSVAAAVAAGASAAAGANVGGGGASGALSPHQAARPWREAELARLLRHIASALAHVHARGLVHLDVKPDNIYMVPAEEEQQQQQQGREQQGGREQGGAAGGGAGGAGAGGGRGAAQGGKAEQQQQQVPGADAGDDAMATDEQAGGGQQQQQGGGGAAAAGGAGEAPPPPPSDAPAPPPTPAPPPPPPPRRWDYKLADFGLAAQRRAGGGSRGVQEGDARYLAAELLRGDGARLDKADVFALGATLYELATGGALPAGGPLWHRLRSGRLSLLPSVGAPLAALLRQLMAEDPAQRPSAAAILRAPALLAAEGAAAATAAAAAGGGAGRR